MVIKKCKECRNIIFYNMVDLPLINMDDFNKKKGSTSLSLKMGYCVDCFEREKL